MQASGYALYSYVHGGNAEVCLSRGRVVLVDGRSKGCWVLGWFLSTDPLTASYPMLTPYQFASNTPIQAIDLDGLEALYIAFPEYKADPEIEIKADVDIPFTNSSIPIRYKAPKVPSGHAGVLIIEPNGMTRYYEYGRYGSPAGVPGLTRKVGLKNNVVFGEDGYPTTKSLNIVLAEISSKSGDGGSIRAAYFETDKTNEMLDFAKGKVAENASSDRAPYDISSNNCGTFAEECILQDENVSEPWIVVNSPNNIVDEYIEEGYPEINFDPTSNTATFDKPVTGDSEEKNN